MLKIKKNLHFQDINFRSFQSDLLDSSLLVCPDAERIKENLIFGERKKQKAGSQKIVGGWEVKSITSWPFIV
jgi:hypothetical protein